MSSEDARAETFVATVVRHDEIAAVAVRSNFPKLAVAAPADVSDVAKLAREVYGLMPDLPCAIGRSTEARAFAAAWESLSGRPPRPGMPQRMHVLRELHAPSGVPGVWRAADPRDGPLYEDWFDAFAREALGEDEGQAQNAEAAARFATTARFLFWLDPGPVSMVGARESGAGVWRVGPVYTPPEYRRRGYAGALTAAMSQEILDRGAACCLFTDLRNPTSNHVYRDIGYEPLADFDEFWFI